MAPGGERTKRRLFLMRHAQAASFAPGGGDRDRLLTHEGEAQARRVGVQLAGAGIERVLASPAVRARQTAEALGLPVQVTVVDALYNCSAATLATTVSRLPEYVRTALVVGHFPGVPGLVQTLVDRQAAGPDVSVLARQFPPATVVELEFTDPWPDLHIARLVAVRRP